MKYFEVFGSEYEMGFAIGKFFKDYLNKKIVKYEKLICNFDKELNYIENKLKNEYPNCLEEIYGRADGAEISRKALLLLYSPELLWEVDGCTDIILKNKYGIFLCHNSDNCHVDESGVALVKYVYGDCEVVTFTVASRLAGHGFFFNSNGIASTCDFLCEDEYQTKNISRYILSKNLLKAKSIFEYMDILKSLKMSSPSAYNVVDIKNNRAMGIEHDMDGLIYFKEVENLYFHTNTNILKTGAKTNFKNETDGFPEDSIKRFIQVEKMIANINIETCKLKDIEKILNSFGNEYIGSIFKKPMKYKNEMVTTGRICLNTSKKEIIVRDFVENSDITFDLTTFLKWLFMF